MVDKDLRSMKINPNPKDNLTKKERKALRSLMHDKEIIIKAADKGGGVVVMDRHNYDEENRRLLSDMDTYVKLKENPSQKFMDELKELLNE
ncbi:Hypothetical predicted protein, partial [Pelobates cultripes]